LPMLKSFFLLVDAAANKLECLSRLSSVSSWPYLAPID
jgi:hypothetical protein